MAGNYPDVPSWRMAYDRDGTTMWKTTAAGVVTQFTTSDMAFANDEGTATGPSLIVGVNDCLVYIFPELRDLDGFHLFSLSGDGTRPVPVEVSTNTTNGVDGTWASIGTVMTKFQRYSFKTEMRDEIVSTTALAIKAVRFRLPNSSIIQGCHLFGEVAPGENPDRLALWHATADARVSPAFFDWGNSPRESSSTKQFRVKNLSPTKTASSIRIAMEVATDSSPSIVSQHKLSSNGIDYLTQINIGDLGPGVTSSVITLKQDMLATAALSLWWFRVFAEATTWA